VKRRFETDESQSEDRKGREYKTQVRGSCTWMMRRGEGRIRGERGIDREVYWKGAQKSGGDPWGRLGGEAQTWNRDREGPI